MKYQYEPLRDEYEFQSFLKDLFNSMYNTKSFEEYGSKGNAQFGVDIYSPELKIAVQAKKKDIKRSKRVLVNELLDDLEKTNELTKQFPHQIHQLFFTTTTQKYIEVQDACISISQIEGRQLQFLSWPDLELEVAKFSKIRRKYYPFLRSNDMEERNELQIQLRDKLELLEKLLTRPGIMLREQKVYRNIPSCEVHLPLFDGPTEKSIIAFILKAALYQTFQQKLYRKFVCLFDFDKLYGQLNDNSWYPGFSIISGEVEFLGNVIRLAKSLVTDANYFWEMHEELNLNPKFNHINFRLEFLPRKGLTAYHFEVDGQTGFYKVAAFESKMIDYDRLDSLNSVLPFIASATRPGFQLIEFDKIEHNHAFMKLIYGLVIQNAFETKSLKVEVNDFDNWDYDFILPKRT